jgi:hypothetical protein
MTLQCAPSLRLKSVALRLALFMILGTSVLGFSQSKPNSPDCHIQPVDYKGWQAQQLSNRWLQLVVVPQNGGRLMQVTFAGHSYLFVNPKFAGKYFPPSSEHWFNYGGDKLWLLPEGNDDEQHWAGNSDILDDGAYAFRKISEGQRCEIELTSPPDPQTGIQFTRTIHIDTDSPKIAFHWNMRNVTGHTVEWSMQSVSQYDTSVSSAQTTRNPNFWTFTPANKSSSYLDRYHVRFGPAENPTVRVRDDDLFNLHYAHMAAELWLDSTDGWLAVVDENTQYAMVERFQYEAAKTYPGKASVIFWTNGPEMHLNSEGNPQMSSDPDASPYYLEAELNSPMCRLRAGESCTMDTEWSPTRSGGQFHGVTDAGIVIQPLTAKSAQLGSISLTGSFGVFYAGHLAANLYDEHGHLTTVTQIAEVIPEKQASVDVTIPAPAKCSRVSLHLIDENGVDRGSLQEVQLGERENH